MCLRWLKKLCKKSPEDEIPAYFIRYTDSGFSTWTETPPNFTQLATDFLCRQQTNCSVYALENYDEEGLIVAAHAITLMRSNIQEAKVLRIAATDITRSGLTVRKTVGETGVKYFDNLHWEIVGNEPAFDRLTQTMHLSILQGKDRHRKITKDLCKHFTMIIFKTERWNKTPEATEALRRALNITA